MVDYKEKIKKLLALSKSPNEHEAQSALAKAQQLMAEYKISMAEVQDVGKKEAIRKYTDATYSPRKDPWILVLANIIAKNYCCTTFSHLDEEKPLTRHLSFIGLEEDMEICLIAFDYALDCIQSQIKSRTAIFKLEKLPQKKITMACNSYAYGFIDGLKENFEKQKKENGWGLIITTPPEVDQKLRSISTRHSELSSKQSKQVSAKDFYEGRKDGRDFDITKRVAAEG